MITVRDLSCGYQRPVLEHLSFEVPAGAITALIGPNGSGKSTLTQALAGLIKFKGQIQIDDLPVTPRLSARTLRQAVGLVFQNPEHQILFSRVQDDLEFILENLAWPVAERAKLVQEALSAVGLLGLAEANPRELSGGQQQRLAIASAIITHPRYLILDEATSMLDPASRQEVYQILQKLAAQGVGILLATNALDELLLAKKVFILQNKHLHTYVQTDLIQNPEILAKHGLQPSLALRLAQKQQLYSWPQLLNFLESSEKP